MYVNSLTCSICGVEITPDAEHVTGACLGCGAESMFPKSDILKLNRITYLRNRADFERASLFCDELIKENPDDSEAYWNKLLCEYGIVYNKINGKRVPVSKIDTSSLPEIEENENYKRTLYNATENMQQRYSAMANAISDSIAASRSVFEKSECYDIFILSPEGSTVDTDFDGDRLFLRFTENLGFKVFFAPETLKDIGEAEKPAYTAAALANSRIMLAAFKKQSECVNGYMIYSVRSFIKAAASDPEKKLFPIFNSQEMLFQQLPEEIVWTNEAFDSSDSEFMREISETVEKLLKPEVAAVVPDSIVTATAANKENLVKRAYMFLEDGEFETADSYFDKILDIDIEESRAYMGKLLADYKLTSEEQIPTIPHPITDDKNFIKALRFASPELKAHYEALNNSIVDYIENEKKRISEERQRLRAEREEKEAIERQRRLRQEKEERKLQYQRRKEPLRKTLLEVEAELNKTFLTPGKRKELTEQKEVLMKNLKELEGLFPDIWD